MIFILIKFITFLFPIPQQMKKLENLGNSFHMREFESLQNECQALDKKIEGKKFLLIQFFY